MKMYRIFNNAPGIGEDLFKTASKKIFQKIFQKIMKTGFLISLSALLAAPLAGISEISYAATNKSIAPLEKKIAHDLNNNVIEFPNKSGKWTIVNYWAQWCGPCQREIPDLNAFYKNNQDKIILVGINSDLLDQKTLQQMAKDLKIQFPILQSDPMKLVDSLVGTPSTYFISPSGQVHGPLLGPQSESSLLKAIQQFS